MVGSGKAEATLVRWFVRGTNTARFASTLAILTKSGVPLVDGMRIANEVVSSFSIRTKLQQAEMSVSEGGSLHGALTRTDQFPPIFLHMVQSGEASGTLDEMLSKSCGVSATRTATNGCHTRLNWFDP